MAQPQAARFVVKSEDEQEDVATAATLLQLHVRSEAQARNTNHSSRAPLASPSHSASSPRLADHQHGAGEQAFEISRGQAQARRMFVSTDGSERSDTSEEQQHGNKRTKNRVAARRYRETRKADAAKGFLTTLKQMQQNQALKKQLKSLAHKQRKRLRRVEAKAAQDQRLAAVLAAARVASGCGHHKHTLQAWSRRLRALLRDPVDIVKEQLKRSPTGASAGTTAAHVFQDTNHEDTDPGDEQEEEYGSPSPGFQPRAVAAALVSTATSAPTPPPSATSGSEAWKPHAHAAVNTATSMPECSVPLHQHQHQHLQHQQELGMPACKQPPTQSLAGAPNGLASPWKGPFLSQQAHPQPHQHQQQTIATFTQRAHQQHQQHQHQQYIPTIATFTQQAQQQMPLGLAAHDPFTSWATSAPPSYDGKGLFASSTHGTLGTQAFTHLTAPAMHDVIPQGSSQIQGLPGHAASYQPHPAPLPFPSLMSPSHNFAIASPYPSGQQDNVQEWQRQFSESQQLLRVALQQQLFSSHQQRSPSFPTQQTHQ